MGESCANCGAALTGRYCAACGQKRFVEADRRFGHLLRQLVHAATDLDGRFWGSLRALLFRPGLLSRDYIAGRRKRWMSPIALFLLVNLVYFFFAPESDFARPFEWEVPGRIAALARDPGIADPAALARLRAGPEPWHSRLTAALVERRVQARDAAARAASNNRHGYDYRDYRRAYDAKMLEISKVLAIVHVPFLAAALLLLFWRKRRYYAEHFVVALHLMAFGMVLIQFVVYGGSLLHTVIPALDRFSWRDWTVRGVTAIYFAIALGRVYEIRWWWSIPATLGLLLAYVLTTFCVYRPVLFLAVYALT